MATSAFADAGDAEREQWFTRGACAELLVDAGAVVTPSVSESLLYSRARGLLELFHHKGLLPRTLTFFAALGDLDSVRAALGENRNDLKTVNDAFVAACRFAREAAASLLLERSIALDPDSGRTLTDTRTACRSSGASIDPTDPTLRRSRRSDSGKCLSWGTSSARFISAT